MGSVFEHVCNIYLFIEAIFEAHILLTGWNKNGTNHIQEQNIVWRLVHTIKGTSKGEGGAEIQKCELTLVENCCMKVIEARK